MKKISNSKGFTLVEILVVVVLLGILLTITAPAIFNTGARDEARAQLIYATGETIVTSWRDIVRGARTNRNPTTGAFFESSNHTALDVLAGGAIAVSASFDNWFSNLGPSRLSGINITRQPTATAAGVYEIQGGIAVSISGYNDTNRTMSITFNPVRSREVEYLKSRLESNETFTSGSADAAGTVQYSAAVGGNHSVTVVYNL